MILSSISDLTRFQIKLISCFVPCPIFLPRTNNPILYKVLYKALSNPVPLTVCALFDIFLASSAIYHLTRTNLDVTTKASITFFGAILPIAILMTVSSLYINADKCVTLLNFILSYEKFLKSEKIRIYQKILKLIVRLLGLPGSFLAPIFLISMNIIEPERAPFVGSVIWAGSRTEYFAGHSIISIAIIGQGWIYCWLSAGACMAIFNVFTATIFSIWVCLVEIKSWTKFTTISKFSLAAILIQQLTKYNELKIIESQTNATFRAMFLPCIILLFAVGNILSTFISISYLRDGTLFQNFGHFYFLLVSLETYLGTLCFGTLSGKVNKMSIQFLKNLEKRSVADYPVLRKRIKASAPIRIRFGSNFFTILIPLVMIGVCIKWTVKLLLIKTEC
ncbi:hypothetical protein Fcan01_19068 [Folsomia candida]|uniref:Uncharacterized protein n=1 Tax=Folsomia candida TaxID=158441 RepID=A0A226DLT5_FOLCA|nr:hypothetical protein Fcan01_19068 [Folsomia candida]